MNWKWLAGSLANRGVRTLTSRPWFPLLRCYPYGVDWVYDIQRFAGSRQAFAMFDVGANVGQTANELLRYFPRSQIECFEPVANTYQELVKRYSRHSAVRCWKLALGSKTELRSILIHQNSERNTLAAIGGAGGGPALATEQVQVETLDRFCQDHAIDRIDLLKMDVQGWEMNVLAGGSGMLRAQKIHFILSEVCFHSEVDDMQDFSELNSYLVGMGYRLCGFYDYFRWGDRRQFLGFCNALYILPGWTFSSW